MNERNTIPVCVITDNNLVFTVPALFIQIMEHASANDFYDFYCFVDSSVSNIDRNKILRTERLFPNCSISFIDMETRHQDAINRLPRVTNACLYKFSIIEKLTQYDKVLYLDTDIVVNDDIAKLYEINIGDNYIGGVFNISYYLYKKHLPAMLKIPDLESYINAGVMIMNLKKMREDNILPELEKYIGQFEGSVDQHIFNKVCYGKIFNIPPKYNACSSYSELYKLPEADVFYTKKEIQEAIESPVIFHYPGKNKPWIYKNLNLAWKWYRSFQKSAFKDYPLQRSHLNTKDNMYPWYIRIKNLMAKIGLRVTNILNIHADFYQYFMVISLIRKKNISPICFIIKSTERTPENENLIELIKSLKEKNKHVYVISNSGGALKQSFKEISDGFFKIRNIDVPMLKSLGIFQFIILSEIQTYKTAQFFTISNMSYLWLLQNSKEKANYVNKIPVVRELINNSNNIIEEFDKQKILDILTKSDN